MAGKSKRASCLDASFRLLSYRDHSVYELKNKLAIREYGEDEIASTIERLLELKYLDDEKYCRSWGAARASRSKIGPTRLRTDLLRKGFNMEIIEVAIDEIFAGLNGEEEAAMEAARKKYYSLKLDLEDDAKRKKIYDYLARRGFSMEIARAVTLDRFDELEDETNS